MGRKLSPPDMELYRRTDEVLHYIWDPIGVAGSPGARDEYESYLPHVFSLTKEGLPDRIVEFLVWVEKDRMGLPPNRAHAEHVAEILIEYREWIRERAS